MSKRLQVVEHTVADDHCVDGLTINMNLNLPKILHTETKYTQSSPTIVINRSTSYTSSTPARLQNMRRLVEIGPISAPIERASKKSLENDPERKALEMKSWTAFALRAS